MRKIHQVMTSSRAAIDLASIMVGIIIIGLIGGVIAATVFAVIPWSQDKAAKQQLESIHTAENALYGLSSDASVTLQGGAARASFGSSTQLDSNNLLTLDKTGSYCVIPTTDGKDYHVYSKSGSGKWFSTTNSKKNPVEYTGSTPCITTTGTPVGSAGQTPGTVDTGVDDGSGDISTTPVTGGTTPSGGATTTPTPTPTATPAPTYFATFDFENKKNWTPYTGNDSVSIVSSPTHGGSSALYTGLLTTNDSEYRAKSSVPTPFIKGKTYRVTAWVYNTGSMGSLWVWTNGTVRSQFASVDPKGPRATATGQWIQVTTTITPDLGGSGIQLDGLASGLGARANTVWDDITIEQL
jgi:type II secretory pathway pseudopilin PulG